MASQKRTWSVAIQAAGNLLPLIFIAPALALAISEAAERGFTLKFGLWILLSMSVGWLSIGLFGFFGNARLKAAARQRMPMTDADQRLGAWFVGFARPSYRGLLDPHEDVGFLSLYPERLDFYGEQRTITLEKKHASKVSRSRNPHSIIGLGGWICVEGQGPKGPIRLQIEPREGRTLLQSRRYRREIQTALEEWLK